MNQHHGKDLAFVIATNLALLDDEVLEFCATRRLHLDLARRPGRPPQQKPAAAGQRQLGTRGRRHPRVRETLGADSVSALMTTTERSLGERARSSTATSTGLTNIFLRPLSPYGFAIKTKQHAAYDVERWLALLRGRARLHP